MKHQIMKHFSNHIWKVTDSARRFQISVCKETGFPPICPARTSQ